MAARWSVLTLGGQLLLAVILAAALAMTSNLSPYVVGALSAAELCSVASLLAVAPLVLGRSMMPEGASRGRVGHMFRALVCDALALEIALGRMALEPCRAPPDSAGTTSSSFTRPVLLVHGFACNRAVWRPLLARLRAAGVGPVRALSLEPLLASIETHVGTVLVELETLASQGAGHAITLVGHSMGGLVARAALRAARPGLIGRIITIGTPHHGTALACWFGWANTRQMCPGSSWLEELNACQEGRCDVPVTILYSLDDNYVIPARSARFQGARAIALQGIGHLGLLTSRRVLEHVASELLG